MAKPVIIDLDFTNPENSANLSVSTLITPDAEIRNPTNTPITEIELKVGGRDASSANFSLSAEKLAEAGLSSADFSIVPGTAGTYSVVTSQSLTALQWQNVLRALQASDSDSKGSFKVTVSAIDDGALVSNAPKDTVAVCFMAGTLIETPEGAREVETLKIGDLVVTTDGRHAAVRWLGRQTISRLFADPLRTTPIRVKANAIDENVPSRDLLISPDHAVLVDGALIQAGALVNGTSVVREYDVPMIFTYFHVELLDHSLIYAEKLPVETFVDNVDRLGFDNWAEHHALYGDAEPIAEMKYPRAKSARQAPQASKMRLAARGSILYPSSQAAVA